MERYATTNHGNGFKGNYMGVVSPSAIVLHFSNHVDFWIRKIFLLKPFLQPRAWPRGAVLKSRQSRQMSGSTNKQQLTFTNVYMGSSWAPLTWIFWKRGKFGSNPLPGLTYFKPFMISRALAPGSWYANWLHGKASTEKPHLYFPAVENSFISAFRCGYWKVYPQNVATFNKRVTCPRYWFSATEDPFKYLVVKLYREWLSSLVQYVWVEDVLITAPVLPAKTYRRKTDRGENCIVAVIQARRELRQKSPGQKYRLELCNDSWPLSWTPVQRLVHWWWRAPDMAVNIWKYQNTGKNVFLRDCWNGDRERFPARRQKKTEKKKMILKKKVGPKYGCPQLLFAGAQSTLRNA